MDEILWIIYLIFITTAGVQFVVKYPAHPWPTEAICLAPAAELRGLAEQTMVAPRGGTIHAICRPEIIRQDMAGNG